MVVYAMVAGSKSPLDFNSGIGPPEAITSEIAGFVQTVGHLDGATHDRQLLLISGVLYICAG